jgi:hypothetical protein
MDNTFIIWPHRKEELQEFLQHLGSIHTNIKFTMEVEQNRSFLFLGVLVSRNLHGSHGHAVYRKPTHKDLHLHVKSEHHLAQKIAILTTFIQPS